MFGRLKRRINSSLGNADVAVDRLEAKALAVLQALEDTLKEGVSFQLEIAGKKIPVKLIIEPDEE